MNYKQTLDYMFSRLPMFQRIGAAAYKADLSNTIEICRLTDNPQNDFPGIHVAGTNGKGSVSHMLASIFQESGFKTALFTSPHLKDFRERMKINGLMIPEEFVCEYVNRTIEPFSSLKPSFFEMTFGMAMSWFSHEKVDIAIIETGMGGRLDSTNIIKPLLSVITNISMDHTQFLGSTLQSIAGEKAGIIKQGTPVVIGETQAETTDIFISKALSTGSEIIFADKLVDVHEKPSEPRSNFLEIIAEIGGQIFEIKSPLIGNYQLKNISVVVASAYLLETILNNIEPLKIEEGIEKTIINTGLKGRWQILNEKPLTICDIGHNTEGIRMVVKQISKLKYNHLHFVIGVVNDKDISAMLALLPSEATYYFCKADIPRGLQASLLQSEAAKFKLQGNVYNSVTEAYEAARNASAEKDLIFIGGSAFTVAEIV